MIDYFLICDTPEFYSDLCDEVRLFFPVKKISPSEKISENGLTFTVSLREDEQTYFAKAGIFENGEKQLETTGEEQIPCSGMLAEKKKKKYILKHTLYCALSKYTGVEQPWGSLTGIRPTKLTRDLKNEVDDPYSYIEKRYCVNSKKASVARKINTIQQPYIDEVGQDDIDIYIGIPFCVTRCSYCSFISREYKRNSDLKDRFLESLFFEIESMRHVLEKKNIRCVYIGGGTPTSLDDKEFLSLLDMVDKNFPVIREYTVEAGRPDTISDFKLECMRDHGVGRISINPQTTNDSTLERVGRPYKNQLFLEVFDRAKSFGFEEINSDIILGLPGEGYEEMVRTLDDVMSLGPSNITVHTLAIKNSSYLRDDPGIDSAGNAVAKACDYAHDTLTAHGYEPYYLYRQKYMTGNLENIGFTRPESVCRYNIDNMEETVSVMAFGAGAISKRIFANENRIERACNVKDLVAYCDRTYDMIARKKALFEPVCGTWSD